MLSSKRIYYSNNFLQEKQQKMKEKSIWEMKKEYDFSKGSKNPYAKQLKKQITINISEEVLDYFKDLSEKTSIPYQSLINFYLLDCVKNKKKIDISWKD